MSASPTVDWEAAEAVAERLGAMTRKLVAERDVDAAKDWALRMARENDYGMNALRSMSYHELSVLLGHSEPAIDDLHRPDAITLQPGQESREHPPHRPDMKARVSALAQREDVERANFAVGTESDHQIRACAVTLEIEQRFELLEPRALSHACAERREPLQLGAGAREAIVERGQRIAQRAQHVESPLRRIEARIAALVVEQSG